MDKQHIKELALANGFKLKQQPNGEMDLNPYVYDFAKALQTENAKLREELSALKHENVSLRSGVKGDLLRLYKDANHRVEKAEAERDDMVSEAYYQGLKAGIFVTPPGRPNGENVTACQISHFENSIDRYCRGLSIQYVEQLRKELEK